jgi:hypothetical protein
VKVQQKIKERLKQEYRRSLRMILKSELNARNKITAIGALAVPELRYRFGIINWRFKEIKQIDRKTRKIIPTNKMHHPRRRELVQVAAAYKAEIINIAKCLKTKYKKDQCVNIVKIHESMHRNMNSIHK